MDRSEALAAVSSFSDAIRATYEPVEGDLLDAEAGLYRIRREIDDRIEPVLLEMGEDRSGFLETVLRTGEVVYERAATGTSPRRA